MITTTTIARPADTDDDRYARKVIRDYLTWIDRNDRAACDSSVTEDLYRAVFEMVDYSDVARDFVANRRIVSDPIFRIAR